MSWLGYTPWSWPGKKTRPMISSARLIAARDGAERLTEQELLSTVFR